MATWVCFQTKQNDWSLSWGWFMIAFCRNKHSIFDNHLILTMKYNSALVSWFPVRILSYLHTVCSTSCTVGQSNFYWEYVNFLSFIQKITTEMKLDNSRSWLVYYYPTSSIWLSSEDRRGGGGVEKKTFQYFSYAQSTMNLNTCILL